MSLESYASLEERGAAYTWATELFFRALETASKTDPLLSAGGLANASRLPSYSPAVVDDELATSTLDSTDENDVSGKTSR